MEEQRQAVRIDINVGVSFRVDAQEVVQKALASRALNAEGIQLLVPGRIPPKEKVEVDLYLPNQQSPLKASGEVAWTEHLGDVYEGYYMVGVQFLELGESVRQAIEELIRAELAKLKPLSSEANQRRVFRRWEGKILSSSRYFATVRLATVTPRVFNSSTSS